MKLVLAGQTIWSLWRVLLNYAKILKTKAKQPITFCENYVTWVNKLEKLVEVLDFISIHTYPQWENVFIDDALNYTIEIIIC